MTNIPMIFKSPRCMAGTVLCNFKAHFSWFDYCTNPNKCINKSEATQ